MLKNELSLIGKKMTFEELNNFMIENNYYNIHNDLSEREIQDCLNENVIAFENKFQDSVEDIYTYIEFEVFENNILKINNIFEM
ncbi:MAG: hypothetical protein ACRDAG_07125 [Cetobacterium somerae]|jgi:hypothetical protein|uniref:Uncharacterized protein n=1 Tax=Cetobacterium somerae ATCC BAA-474 TaxID=1319815 RepID=U7VAK9_9FUSO|nr:MULTISPECIES: hypothetical protein [Cetobacterium]ERT68561.1 hypothetical protein HMPREF0202_01521 [Cetobacterium somerae ATCC BAA-474]MBC2854280.1 hypothetical protein [Cetobacterium sp. 2G large]MCQ9626716.1 hypothetical protein [Cetobacterium somerae]WVJ02600.1 hypothetical protein VSU16_10945 [Cetobacterium somerae]